MKNIKIANVALGNTICFSLRIRPQDLSLEPIVLQVFSFGEVLEYATNNARDVLEVALMKDDERIVEFKIVFFDKINQWNVYHNLKNFMISDLNLDSFKEIMLPIVDDTARIAIEAIDD